uniref:DNA topoisomerase (ATP-hydrolyzing) n=1 Tax=viral metagenome TaxID=1070528 RepID=A0A6C0EI32_9ZZZZ
MTEPNIKVSIKPKGQKRVILKKKSTSSIDSQSNQSQLSNVSDIYKRMSHIQHVLTKPDSYVGSTQLEQTEQYVLNDTDAANIKIENVEFSYCPAFYKCFDELLVNAFDHSKRQLSKIKSGNTLAVKVTNIKIEINVEKGYISVYNDGDGIDIEIIPEYDIYPPELIFGTLLTSTNYNDEEKREWGGRNGYGAKLANIFSKQMDIETVDKNRGKKLCQTFRDNMSVKETAVISKCSTNAFTKVVWYPDFMRFNMTNIDESHLNLMKKRVYDIAACSDKDLNVYLNNTKLQEKTFEKYVNLYIGDKTERARVYEEGDGWSVVATYNKDEIFDQVSFVNGINTSRGGKHVDYIVDQIKDKLGALIKKKKKLNVKSIYIKNQLQVFVNATVVNPIFDGQTKETLKTNKNKFEHYIELSDRFIDNLFKTDITDRIMQQTNYKDNKSLEKTDGKKNSYIKIPKLSDANLAGTKHSKDCVLVLTEGDSAKTMAISGLAEIGRSKYGVFPLKGKLLNVRDSSNSDILKNVEISNIKKILGLQSNKNYDKAFLDKGWPLRYGKIMIMTDQDLDGSHIKGLLINLFDHLWPLLLDQGFICSMITPIIKAKKNSLENVFYTLQDYEIWKKLEKKGWTIKYYKGLGTSTTKEAKEYFKNMKIVNYVTDDSVQEEHVKNLKGGGDYTTNRVDLAFRKDRANDRKLWLNGYDRDKIPDYNNDKISCNTFIDDELSHYSTYDNVRSIPDIRDGLKPSTRKIIFSCFKRNLVNELKVAQLAGYVSEKAAYHHGEKSLEGAIVGLAQNFLGSNNLNLLQPDGQFGTRLLGGKDAAQSRYIFTQFNKMTKIIFNSLDEPLYNYLDDDGTLIEPEAYCGILPMVLVNGAEGIGTGFSTSIPCYNPIDLANIIQKKLAGEEYSDIKPWYRGFTGNIDEYEPNAFITKGLFTTLGQDQINISELPIGSWTEKYVEFLDKSTIEKGSKDEAKQFIKSYVDNSSESKVDITIKFNQNTLYELLTKDIDGPVTHIAKQLKLTTKLSTTNMWLFNTKRRLHKYNTIYEIIDEWFIYRHELYVKRKEYILNKLNKELNIIKYKVLFINEIISNTLDIRGKKKSIILTMLEEKSYPKLTNKLDDAMINYDYLFKMDLYKLTEEEIDLLTKQRDMKLLEVSTLEETTIEQLWSSEINDFKALYEKDLKNYVLKKKLVIKKK